MSRNFQHWRHPLVIVVVLLAGALRLPHEVDDGHGLLFAAQAHASNPAVGSNATPCSVPAENASEGGCSQSTAPSPFDLLDPNRFPLYTATDRSLPQE